jgi:hypothetical protein
VTDSTSSSRFFSTSSQLLVLADEVALLAVGAHRGAHRQHDVLVEEGLLQEPVEVRLIDRALDAGQVALPGQQDLDRVRAPFVQPHQELVTLHAGHHEVGNDEPELATLGTELFGDLQRLVAALGELDLQLGAEMLGEHAAQRVEDRGIVIHAQDDAALVHAGASVLASRR